MKKYLILIILFLTSCAVPVPTVETKVTSPYISGKIVECGTNLSIRNAKVRFEGRESDFVLSDNDGNFTMENQTDLVLLRVHTPCPVYNFPKPRKYPGFIIITLDNYKELKIPLKPFYEKHKQKMIEHAMKGKPFNEKLKILLSDICIENNG